MQTSYIPGGPFSDLSAKLEKGGWGYKKVVTQQTLV